MERQKFYLMILEAVNLIKKPLVTTYLTIDGSTYVSICTQVATYNASANTRFCEEPTTAGLIQRESDSFIFQSRDQQSCFGCAV
jgi:hypothetical protein